MKGFMPLPTGTIDTCRDGLKMARRLLETLGKPRDEVLAYFFSWCLRPYYECMWDGMEVELGHVIYNLSDLVPEEQRKCFMVYPNSEKEFEWDTLEDFRKEWKADHPDIPNLLHLLNGEEKFLLLNK